jgi:hypothetical protein
MVGYVMKRRVVITDRMQHGYVYYLTEPMGRHFDPGFEPQLTPRQMLRLGVFGGKYMTDCRDELHGPADARRRTADSAMAGDRPARRSHPEPLRQRRRGLPATAAAGRAPLGL